MIKKILIAVVPLLLTGFVYTSDAIYKLSKPNQIYILPDKLKEISGLTDVSPNAVGCVQDEMGTIFIYDLLQKAIIKEISIVSEGDYEGLTIVNNDMYMLRSDGTLTEVKNYNSLGKKITTYQLSIQTSNNEGLCYDEKQNRLLIAAKSKIGKGHELKDIRVIYAFDLKNKILESKPIIEFSVKDIETYANIHKIKFPLKEKKKGEGFVSALRFMPSSIAIHPTTDNVYMLSAIDRMFLVLDKKGKIIYLEQLDAKLFIKPEGITFMKNGDMYISNEGEGSDATLLKFKSN